MFRSSRSLSPLALLIATFSIGATAPVSISAAAPAAASGTGSVNLDTALGRFRADHGPNWSLKVDAQTGYLEMLYGGSAVIATNARTDEQFESFARTALGMTQDLHGIDADTLVHERTTFLPLGQIGSSDKETVRFRQEVGGVRVVNGFVNVLFSSTGTMLSVQSTGMPRLSGFDTTPTISERMASAIGAATFETRTGMPPTVVEAPELVVDQIANGGVRRPVLAYLVNAQRYDADADPVGWRYSIDARTGDVLRQEASVHFDVFGTVTAMTSPGLKPDEASNPPAAQVIKYMACTAGATTVYTDVNGNFNFPGINVATNVTFQFTGGARANVTNSAGANYSLTLSCAPNTQNGVLMNPAPAQAITAQANAGRCLPNTSDFIHSIVPGDTHADFSALAHVMVSGTCNAFYNGSSVNFYPSGGGCNNTAYTTVIAHEFGHWMNQLYGTGNGNDGMGEGNADAWAECIYDTPIMGQDFCGGNCNVRTGNNNRQFCGDCCDGCYGEVHNDGEVWMGAHWKVRSRLENTNGGAQGALIDSTLFMGWMNAYNQTQIKSIIETQWVTLDDNNGNINDGSPHFTDIDGGFRQQGFPGLTTTCQTPSNYCQTSPNSVGSGATMSFAGQNFVAQNNFDLYAYGLPPNKLGVFFYGQNQANVPYGNGRRCVGNPFFRLPSQVSNDFGDLFYHLDLTTLPSGGQILPGQTWNFAAYYRDPAAGGANFNATDGLSVLWCN
jgi:hypothetical protein